MVALNATGLLYCARGRAAPPARRRRRRGVAARPTWSTSPRSPRSPSSWPATIVRRGARVSRSASPTSSAWLGLRTPPTGWPTSSPVRADGECGFPSLSEGDSTLDDLRRAELHEHRCVVGERTRLELRRADPRPAASEHVVDVVLALVPEPGRDRPPDVRVAAEDDERRGRPSRAARARRPAPAARSGPERGGSPTMHRWPSAPRGRHGAPASTATSPSGAR